MVENGRFYRQLNFFKKIIQKLLTQSYKVAIILIVDGELAQLARAPALHAGGQGFESLILHHFFSESSLAW